ncbi:hypothetical protein EVAR_86989_1 [Eumeta japonica]|uniref:Uncharacterized protein n=1 Tax=Eumeta variegata TaxID=151549 RepID=A0A4C1W5U7_EUMVA|nr:hypothetical protein EVAR_86989_1 [Eumeta japonica]
MEIKGVDYESGTANMITVGTWISQWRQMKYEGIPFVSTRTEPQAKDSIIIILGYRVLQLPISLSTSTVGAPRGSERRRSAHRRARHAGAFGERRAPERPAATPALGYGTPKHDGGALRLWLFRTSTSSSLGVVEYGVSCPRAEPRSGAAPGGAQSRGAPPRAPPPARRKPNAGVQSARPCTLCCLTLQIHRSRAQRCPPADFDRVPVGVIDISRQEEEFKIDVYRASFKGH